MLLHIAKGMILQSWEKWLRQEAFLFKRIFGSYYIHTGILCVG